MRTTTHYQIPEQNDIEIVRESIAIIQTEFYDTPMSSARRLAIGTKLRKISDEVYNSLTEDEQRTLREYHRASNKTVRFLVEQRRIDSLKQLPTYIDFDTLTVLVSHHNNQLDVEAAAKSRKSAQDDLESAFI